MRASAALFHSSPVSKTATTETTAAGTRETFSPPATIENLSWHSPVPYLFGGLAAMLGLIAFALLILACSYWKLSGQDGGGVEGGDSGPTSKGDGGEDTKASPPFEEKFLVIMAGDVKPTFLATPTPTSNSSFKNDNQISDIKDKENEKIPENVQEFREIQLSQDYVRT